MSTKNHLETDRSAELAQKLLRRCMVFGDYTMHSGEHSLWLFDCLKLFEDPDLFRQAMDALKLYWPVAGIEYGGSLLAAMRAGEGNSTPILVRKESEGGGIYYAQNSGRAWEHKITLIDDVVTTGTSMWMAKMSLEMEGFKVIRQVCILNRSPNQYPAECLVTRQEAVDYYQANKPESHRQTPGLL